MIFSNQQGILKAPEPVIIKEKEMSVQPKFIWVLDPGHGKRTRGKRSPKFEDGTQMFEYEFNRAVNALLMDKLDVGGLKYYNLIPTDDDKTLKTRVEEANNLQSDLPKRYLSIHSNGAGDGKEWHSAHGLETFRYRASQTGLELAEIFQKHLVNELEWRDRGVKEAGYYVIRHTKFPAILTETGFYTNKDECVKLMSPEYREKIAEAHFLAMKEYEETYG